MVAFLLLDSPEESIMDLMVCFLVHVLYLFLSIFVYLMVWFVACLTLHVLMLLVQSSLMRLIHFAMLVGKVLSFSGQ